jgi:hypothetical protein
VVDSASIKLPAQVFRRTYVLLCLFVPLFRHLCKLICKGEDHKLESIGDTEL